MMAAVRDWAVGVGRGWDRFWFTPADPRVLGLIRICAGALLFYTHLVWSFELAHFFGPDAWVAPDVSRTLGEYRWSPFWHVDSPWLLWTLHLAALASFALLTLGLWTRPAAVLSWLFALAYCHRADNALFGLDQVNVMLAMYLAIGPSGAAWSVDRLRADRAVGGAGGGPRASVSANLALRLIQVHLCIVYLFGGIAKMRGLFWWDGSAFWLSIANLEYQSLDLTWTAQWPWLIAVLTHVTVFWEAYYCALIWPRATRPVMLALAVAVHGGIALALGMITFGVAMLIANLAFVPPEWIGRRSEPAGDRGGRGESAELAPTKREAPAL